MYLDGLGMWGKWTYWTAAPTEHKMIVKYKAPGCRHLWRTSSEIIVDSSVVRPSTDSKLVGSLAMSAPLCSWGRIWVSWNSVANCSTSCCNWRLDRWANGFLILDASQLGPSSPSPAHRLGWALGHVLGRKISIQVNFFDTTLFCIRGSFTGRGDKGISICGFDQVMYFEDSDYHVYFSRLLPIDFSLRTAVLCSRRETETKFRWTSGSVMVEKGWNVRGCFMWDNNNSNNNSNEEFGR